MSDQTPGPPAPQAWRNRIIGQEDIDPRELKANPRNWRKHPKQQQEVLTGVLDEVGWVDQVLVNKRTGLMIDGHLRVELALKRHEKLIPVTYVDLSEEEEALVLATFDPISAMAMKDKDALQSVIEHLTPSSEAVRDLLAAMTATDEDRGAALRLAEMGGRGPKTEVEYGDKWAIGDHIMVVRDVLDEWPHWIHLLTEGKTLAIYAGPLIAISDFGRSFLIVQPEPMIAGYIVDRWIEQRGAEGVKKLS